MSGGLTELITVGQADVYLTGNPEITFFKNVYLRHTNFAMEEKEQIFDTPLLSDTKSKSIISRDGDLVGNCILEFDILQFDNEFSYYPAEQCISSVELHIGSTLIDKYDSWWMRVWSELNLDYTKKKLYRTMTNLKTRIEDTSGSDDFGMDVTTLYTTLQLPLLFSFCRNVEQYLPLCNILYDDITITIQSSQASTSIGQNVSSISNAKLWCNYIYLDSHERKLFMQKNLDYIFQQTQCLRYNLTTPTSEFGTYDIDTEFFNNPVKYLAWVLNDGKFGLADQKYGATGNVGAGSTSPATYTATTDQPQIMTQWSQTTRQMMSEAHNWYNDGTIYMPEYAALMNVPFSSVKIRFDTVYRFSDVYGGNFVLPQNYFYFEGRAIAGIYTYSFALKPSEVTLTGTCNYSRFDTSELILEAGCDISAFSGGIISVYAVSINILRISEGRVKLLYPTDLGY